MRVDSEQTNFECQAWAAEQIKRRHGCAPTEFSLIKARAWSTVWKVSTRSTRYFLKACGPGFEREARLLPLIASEFADVVPQVIAADDKSNWLLSEDAGQSLHEIITDDRDQALEHLRAALRAYAKMQFEISKGRSRVGPGNLADHSLERLPDRLHFALDDAEMLSLGGATEQIIARRAGAVERCRDLCLRLALFGVPHSIEHGDLHPNNIMVGAEFPRIIDWGDASWSHPFCSMAICLDMSRQAFGGAFPEEGDVVAAYLDIWRSMGSEATLLQAVALATALRPVHGILLWTRAYNAMQGEARRVSAGHAVQWLGAF